MSGLGPFSPSLMSPSVMPQTTNLEAKLLLDCYSALTMPAARLDNPSIFHIISALCNLRAEQEIHVGYIIGSTLTKKDIRKKN